MLLRELFESGPNAFSPANCGYSAPSTSPITGITADPYYDEPLNRPDITRTFREYVNNGLSWKQARDRTVEKYGLKSVKINGDGKCTAFEKQGPIHNPK